MAPIGFARSLGFCHEPLDPEGVGGGGRLVAHCPVCAPLVVPPVLRLPQGCGPVWCVIPLVMPCVFCFGPRGGLGGPMLCLLWCPFPRFHWCVWGLVGVRYAPGAPVGELVVGACHGRFFLGRGFFMSPGVTACFAVLSQLVRRC
jgi:hypothetical protein